MANLLRGIVQGTTETVQQTAKDVGRKALSTMPSPSNALYNLGLGVGPLIKNIVEASKENSANSKPNSPVSKKEFADVTKASVGQTAELLQLTRTSVSILKDIKTELIKSSKSTARERMRDRRITPARATSSITTRPLTRMIPGVGATPQDGAQSTIKEKVTEGTNTLGLLLKGLFAAGGAIAAWQLLPENTKNELKKSGALFAETIGKDVVEGVGSLLKKAWEANAPATALAGLIVAKMTGVLGLAIGLAKGAITTGRGLYQFGKAMATPNVVGPAAAGAAASTASARAAAGSVTGAPAVPPPAGGFGNALRRMVGIEEKLTVKPGAAPIEGLGPKAKISAVAADYKELKKFTSAQYADEVFGKKYGPQNLEAIRSAAGAPSPGVTGAQAAGAAAERAPAGSKLLTGAKILGGLGALGAVASVGTGVYDIYQTGEAEKRGEITKEQANVRRSGTVGEVGGGLAAGAYGAGKGAILGAKFGLLFGPVGAAIGAIGGGLIGGGLAAYAGSKLGRYAGETYGNITNFFGSGTTPQEGAGTQGPTATGIQQSGSPADFATTRFSDLTEDQKTAFLEGQGKAEGFGRPGTIPTTHNNPGAIMWSRGGFVERFGGGPGRQARHEDGRPGPTIAMFPTLEQGKAAQRALWETPRYSNRPIAEALKTWHGASGQHAVNYASAISQTMQRGSSAAGPMASAAGGGQTYPPGFIPAEAVGSARPAGRPYPPGFIPASMSTAASPQGAGTQGPTPSATQPTSQVSGGTTPGVDNNKLLGLIRKFESSGNYSADNKVGFVGAYQTGSEALETVGLLKPGSSKGRTTGANAAVYDPSAWTPGYSLQKYLQDKELQDTVASKLMKMKYEGMVKAGVITNNMSEADIASRIYTAWAGGVGGATALFLRGENREDFHFKGAGTAHAAAKMAKAYGSTPSGQGTVVAAGMPSTISPQSVQTAAAASGNALADQQDMFSMFASAMAGEKVTVNLSQIIQNAMSEGSKGSGGPSPAGPSSRDAALDRAHKAIG